MPRRNEEAERLERENGMLRAQIERMRQDPGDVPFLACDHSCVCASAKGQATNGGCRCDERELRRAVQWWRRRAQFLQATIQEMRDAMGENDFAREQGIALFHELESLIDTATRCKNDATEGPWDGDEHLEPRFAELRERARALALGGKS